VTSANRAGLPAGGPAGRGRSAAGEEDRPPP
jgi:hypothetical protein